MMSKKISIAGVRAGCPLLFLFLLLALTGGAQPFSNSWISFSNTYHKFGIGKEGIYRITKSQLDALGFGSVPGNQFAVFREGKEVPIYTSTNGLMGAGDYIELYATKADGRIDSLLYPNPDYQGSKRLNLLTDTATYFLTYDNTVHQRMSLVNNAIPSPAPSPAAWCWATSLPDENPRSGWDPGQSHNLIQQYGYFYSSDYDLAEGYSYSAINTSAAIHVATPQAAAGGPLATVMLAIAGHSIVNAQAHPTVTLNGGSLYDTVLNTRFRLVKRNLNVAPASLTANNTFSFSDAYNFFVMEAAIRYPRTYNFSGNFSSSAAFEVPAADRYLEISGFNTGGQTPLLYDRSNNKIYTGTESGGVVRFYLDASVVSRNVFLSSIPAVAVVANFRQVQFRNYAAAANQGNYIILTHKKWIESSPSYVNDFKSYRARPEGGGYTPVVVDVTELYDQFAYGYEYHPIAIRNFTDYALNTWTQQPRFMFIIGKGIDYTAYSTYRQSPSSVSYAPVPTWGSPGSDNLLTSFNNDQKPRLATGRLSAWNNQEIGNYLEKVRAYENAIRPLDVPTSEHELWKKRALHVVGSSDLQLQDILAASLQQCEYILEDTLVGGIVTTIRKTGTDPVEDVNNPTIDLLMNKGLGYVSFYGHGSSSGFDYNLNSPDDYNSTPRFPIFSSFACEVAHIFSYGVDRTVSERYINSTTGGSIVMIAGNNSGWTSTLPSYMQNLYRSWSYRDWGKTLGEQYQNNIHYLQNISGDVFMDIHTQCLLYQGDPALARYNPEKPDFAVETDGLSSQPVNTTMDSFTLQAVVYSLGKSTSDSVTVRVQHTRPGNTTVLYTDSLRLPYLYSTDTVRFRIPVDPNTDIGLNNYTVKVDSREAFDELSEANNEASLQIFIYSENLVPVYPREFSIMHNQDITLKASTLNAFAPEKSYIFEIDTTGDFNSSLKQSVHITSGGGLLKWKPAVNYMDSVVYYWRAAPDSLVNGSYAWSVSSFLYLTNGSDGWNQSHYHQYKKDEPYSGLELPADYRKFRFGPLRNTFKVEDKVVNGVFNDYHNVRQSLNDRPFDGYGCGFTGAIQIVVIDSTTGQPWRNTVGLYNPGIGGSIPACYDLNYMPMREMFEFLTNSAASRNNARLFIENIPEKSYVLIKNLIYDGNPPAAVWDGTTINDWKADTAIYGPGNSLYHTIKNMGFDMIDQFTYKRAFAFFRQKGVDPAIYPITQKISQGADDKIEFTRYFNSYPDTGMVTSTLIGPAKEWQSLKWQSLATDNLPVNDSPYVTIYGVNAQGEESLIRTVVARDTSLSFIDAAQYPNLRLRWYSVDNITRTSAHLGYWRVLYSPVPEAALNAAAHFEFADSLGEGQKGKLRIAIENLTPLAMDSMLVHYKIIDAGNVKHDLATRRYRALPGNDTLIADLDFDISSYHGHNYLFIEANPGEDQPEQYHPNNLGYLPIYVHADKYNPLLDVTFDGVHILNRDIVSAKPFIKALLRDENKFMPLSDTALLKVQLVYPNQTVPVNIPIDGTICKFIPADSVNSTKNEARIEFRPNLPEDGVYKLMVSGRDKVGNVAGSAISYDVEFTVENKPSITHVLNYPNPFSTSTRFIFTMTGSEIPSQFKIQILTVTGKVVREIKKFELGDLHIGRNITEYAWDGKDEYGQMLGNGVYLYRVITSIRGEDVEQRKNTAVDKYFKNGYGKLYIMR